MYKPSFKAFVFDPSFAICNAPISKIYTFEGKMHISGKNQCSSYAPGMPELIYGTHKALWWFIEKLYEIITNIIRGFVDGALEHKNLNSLTDPFSLYQEF